MLIAGDVCVVPHSMCVLLMKRTELLCSMTPVAPLGHYPFQIRPGPAIESRPDERSSVEDDSELIAGDVCVVPHHMGVLLIKRTELVCSMTPVAPLGHYSPQI